MVLQSGEPYRGQKYSSIKKDCLKKGELFVDPEFPPNHKSLFFSKVDQEIEWRRPKELCKVPRLVVEGVSSDDLNEGELGNTWFVSACSSLTQEPKLWQKVVPNHKEQEWGVETQYAGIFHFQFWRYGRWVDVVVDDLLPTRDGKLVFCHAKARNEFWSALLEKAYAKLYGDYESLVQGQTADALVDFTGGVSEKLELTGDKFNPQQTFSELLDALDNRALVICNMTCSKEDVGKDASQGLIKGHGYGVTAVKDIQVNKAVQKRINTASLRLLRLRNPWGTKEWTGPWSDESAEWNNLSAKDREKMGIKFEREGEFWMSYDDFTAHFDEVSVCHFVNTSFFSIKKSWNEALVHGEWVNGARGTDKDRAGGCEQHRDTFLYNPQYAFDISGYQDDVMTCLEQGDVAENRRTGSDFNKIGFHVMKVEDNRKYRVHIPGIKMTASEYLPSRSVFHKFQLPRGRYVIIPSTLHPGIIGKFLLRMYTGGGAGASYLRPLMKEGPKQGICVCMKPYQRVTYLKVVKAEGLQPIKAGQTMDPYISVRCEGDTVKSAWVRGTDAPMWNMEVIFYRKNVDLPVTVEVWNHNAIMDDFLGQVEIHKLGSETKTELDLQLYGRKKESELEKPGKLYVEMLSSDDLTAL